MSYTTASKQATPATPARSARSERVRTVNERRDAASVKTSKRALKRAAERAKRDAQLVAEIAVINAKRNFAQASHADCKRKIHNTMPARVDQPARTLYATPATAQLEVTPARVAALMRSADISRAADKTEQRARRNQVLTRDRVRNNDSQVVANALDTSLETMRASRDVDLVMLRSANARKRAAGERI
jgi:hypothetical protein